MTIDLFIICIYFLSIIFGHTLASVTPGLRLHALQCHVGVCMRTAVFPVMIALFSILLGQQV